MPVTDQPQTPFVPQHGVWRPIGSDQAVIEGGFWQNLQSLNSTMIQQCDYWLEQTGWMKNFDAAVEGRLPQDRTGREFSDSETYKLLEAMSWQVGRTGDQALDARLESITARVGAAQSPDGYISTMYGRDGQGARYSNLMWGHELYCMGHLIQAGVARGRTKGVDSALTKIAISAADHICAEFGDDGNQGYCGHPEVEVALAELSRLTGDPKYRAQARRFIERRGNGLFSGGQMDPSYFQDDMPVRQATVLRGHAVRALYLESGVTDVAVDDEDHGLLRCAIEQMTATLARRTYLTGGMGSRHTGEAIGADWELSPDRAYCETCAGIASVMANQRLLLATGDAQFADAVERALYNVLAASPSGDGRSFFYTNPLQQREPGVPMPENEVCPRSDSAMRAAWFEVSCCPTNVTRMLASLASYVASQTDSGVQLSQWVAGTVRAQLEGGLVSLHIATSYPDGGEIAVTVDSAPPTPWTLSLRVPQWAEGATLTDGGVTRPVAPGYAAVTRVFQAGDVIGLTLPVAPRWTYPDPRVDAVRGQVAVECGPVVQALESVDAGVDVGGVAVDVAGGLTQHDGRVWVELAPVVDRVVAPWQSRRGVHYGPPREVPLIPYHQWANRGPSTMRVWIPTT